VLTRLVGRDRQVDELLAVLAGHRLVTLTGMGGVGKSRVALAVAEQTRSHGRRVVWVDVARLPAEYPERAVALPGADDVAEAVAAVACGDAEPHRATPQRLLRELSGADTLLVLDGCDRVLAGARNLVDLLLGACPRLDLLVTTREMLGVPGEFTWPVPPLPVDADAGDGAAGARADRDDAVRLFHDRALEARPSFPQDPDTIALVARICRRLEGLPLAIELAAARLRVLSLAQVAAGLHDCCRLLAAPGAAVPPRHRTLQATLDASHELLPAVEAAVFRRLAVFPGGAYLSAVQAVADADVDVLDPLTRLVERSLVLMQEDGGQARYRLPEAVRQYAWAHLEAAGEADLLQERLAAWSVDLLEPQVPPLADAAWLDAVEQDLANLRQVMAWACRSRPRVAVRLAGRLWRFSRARGRYAEGRSWAVRALEAFTSVPAAGAVPGPDLLRELARARHGAGVLAFLQCDYEEALGHLDTALTLYPPDDDAVVEVLRTRASIARERGEYDRATELLHMIREQVRTRGDRSALPQYDVALAFTAWLAGDARTAAACAAEASSAAATGRDPTAVLEAKLVTALVAATSGALEPAGALLEQVLADSRRHGAREATAYALHALGGVARGRGDPAAAAALLRQALALHHELGDRWRASGVLDDLAWCALASGRVADAALLLGASDAAREAIGVPVPAVDRSARADVEASVRTSLGVKGYRSGWADGHAAGLDGAVDHVNRSLPARLIRVLDVAEPPPLLTVTSLGRCEVRLDGRALSGGDWGYAKPRELLHLLLIRPPCTKADVGLALWPEADLVALRGAFHTTLNRLRRALGPARVVYDGGRYTLDRGLPLRYDVDGFRSAVRAVADVEGLTQREAKLRLAVDAYTGPFLEGEPVGEWADEVRRELQAEAERCILELARLVLERGEAAEAAHLLERALALDPLLEAAHRGIMLCQVRLGEPGRALRHYAALRETLRRELDVDPAPATTALARRIGATACPAHPPAG
jgi:predicted ATPase/two-component SAPR family response regulator